MIAIPVLPLETSAKELVDFCLSFRTVQGFIEVFEQKWQEFDCAENLMGAAYEATEMLYNQLFGQRRYKDREVFYSARCRHYSREN